MSAILACLAFALLTSPFAQAASEPDVVAAEVKKAAEECRRMGGRPNTQGMLKVDDLNGDGREDWIIDYAKLQCRGSTPPFCGSGGCLLQIFLWTSGQTWKLVFDDNVHKYSRTRHQGRPAMQFDFGGSVCDRPNYQSCRKVYIFQGEALEEVQ